MEPATVTALPLSVATVTLAGSRVDYELTVTGIRVGVDRIGRVAKESPPH